MALADTFRSNVGIYFYVSDVRSFVLGLSKWVICKNTEDDTYKLYMLYSWSTVIRSICYTAGVQL